MLNFSIVDADLTYCLKHEEFVWTEVADKSFITLKVKLCSARVLAMLDFENPFEIDCDALVIGIGDVLSQDGHPISYYSEKNCDARNTYLVQVLK